MSNFCRLQENGWIYRLIALFFFASIWLTPDLKAEEKRPNFVWLISEDNSKHYLKLFDQTGVETPNINQLASHGLVFENAFSNSPVCSVARTTLLTSCYAPRIGAQYHRRAKLAPLPPGLTCFPARLRANGYYTTNRSKKDYNVIEQDLWDESSRKATWQNRDSNQPFFHQQTFGQSHEGSLHFSEWQKNSTITDDASVFVAPYHPQTDLFRHTNARYRDRIRIVDQKIGEVIQSLQNANLLEDTFIFYFGDHGGVLPRSKGYLYESGLHVPLVVRIPKNFRHLVQAKNQTNRVADFVSFVDFGPTVLKLAGLEPSEGTDGNPFLGPERDRQNRASKTMAFGYADRFDEKSDLVRSLRKGRYKYIRNFEPLNFDGLHNEYRNKMLAYQQWLSLFKANKLNDAQRQFFEPKATEALFDLSNDPHETNNLAFSPQMAPTLRELRGELMEKLKAMPDLSFYPESHLVEHAFDSPTRFGQKNKQEIGELIETANLALSAEMFRAKIDKALGSANPWIRYWALNACPSHPKIARKHAEAIRKMAASDSCLLARIKAAEFLAIYENESPSPYFEAVLNSSTNRIEQAIVLNSATVLRDGYARTIKIERDWFEKRGRQDNVERRLAHLLPSQK